MAEPTVAELVAAGETIPAVDLVSWAAGYVAGYDTAAAGAVAVVLRALAEGVAELDRATFVEPGRLDRERRIAREVADDRHARPVRQSDDWPPVAVPGGGT